VLENDSTGEDEASQGINKYFTGYPTIMMHGHMNLKSILQVTNVVP